MVIPRLTEQVLLDLVLRIEVLLLVGTWVLNAREVLGGKEVLLTEVLVLSRPKEEVLTRDGVPLTEEPRLIMDEVLNRLEVVYTREPLLVGAEILVAEEVLSTREESSTVELVGNKGMPDA